ncbi:TetR/AcrR family transcriptional regulator [Zhongshania sp.]|uniref:TetR/AcrR family transcriptional regulator n=1 Tax=Zhongshania sp. TaxID=1971902 RepID=UPI0035661452
MGRPSKPIITKELAAKAALSVIDRQGIAGMSLQLVAQELGVKAPSLYYHFENKAELLAEVVRYILLEASISEEEHFDNWRDALVDLTLSIRESILLHPRAAPLLMDFFPRHLILQTYEFWISKFDIPVEKRMMVVDGMEKLTFGSAMLGAMSRVNGKDPMPSFSPTQFPHLNAATTANQLDETAMFVATAKAFLSAF